MEKIIQKGVLYLLFFVFVFVFVFSYFEDFFNKSIIPVPLVGCEMTIANSYPTPARGNN